MNGPWLVWLSGLSASLWIKELVQFPIRAHDWVATRSPVGGTQGATTHWCFSPSLPLSKNKWNLKKNLSKWNIPYLWIPSSLLSLPISSLLFPFQILITANEMLGRRKYFKLMYPIVTREWRLGDMSFIVFIIHLKALIITQPTDYCYWAQESQKLFRLLSQSCGKLELQPTVYSPTYSLHVNYNYYCKQ